MKFCMRNFWNCFVTIYLHASKHVIFSCKLNVLCFLKSKFAFIHLLEISKTLWIFILTSVGLRFVNMVLVSSANYIGIDIL